MRPFRFRASAALDLRRREEQDAGAALARAEAHFHEAKATCEAAEGHRADAQAAQLAEARRGTDMATLFWHRNWILRLQATVTDLRGQLHRHALAVEHAERAWRLARRRRMALDRMRDRALARYRADEHRQELKVIDELARLRHVVSEAGAGRDEA
jgi:flagellar export protein FliJ